MGKCPASNGGLTCTKQDGYSHHMSLTHRDEEAQREWGIQPEDRKRWGMLKVKIKVTEVKPDQPSEKENA